METDRAKLQDTSEGLYDPKGINIHEDTLQKPKTDTAKGSNSVDSKGLNCQDCKTRVHINKQSPDIVADGVHVDKGDFDDFVVLPQAQIVEKTVEIPQIELRKIAGEEISSYSDFGRSRFVHSDLVCVMEGSKKWGPNPERSGPEGWGPRRVGYRRSVPTELGGWVGAKDIRDITSPPHHNSQGTRDVTRAQQHHTNKPRSLTAGSSPMSV